MTAEDWNEQVVSGCHRSYNGIPMLTASQRRERDAMLDRERLATRLAFADTRDDKHPAQALRCAHCHRKVKLGHRYCTLCVR